MITSASESRSDILKMFHLKQAVNHAEELEKKIVNAISYETIQKTKLASNSNFFIYCFRNLLLDQIHFLHYKLLKKMTLFSDPKIINPGDQVYHEYDDKKAFGTVASIDRELLEVDFTTEQSTEPKIEKFRHGFWKKVML